MNSDSRSTTPIPADDSGRPTPASGLDQFQMRVEGTPATITAIQRGVATLLARYGFNSAQGQIAAVPTAEEREAQQRAWEDEEELNKKPSTTTLWAICAFLVGVALTLWLMSGARTHTKVWMNGIDPSICSVPVTIQCEDCKSFGEDVRTTGSGENGVMMMEFDAYWHRQYALEPGKEYTFWVDLTKIDLACLDDLQIDKALMPKVRIMSNTDNKPLDYFVQSCKEGGGEEDCKTFDDFGWRNGTSLRTLPGGELQIRVNPPN